MQAFIAKAALFWASKKASNLLISAIAVVLAAGVWYVQGLRVEIAECRAAQEQAAQYSRLAERYAERLKEDVENEKDTIRDADHGCLDTAVGELLGGEKDGGS